MNCKKKLYLLIVSILLFNSSSAQTVLSKTIKANVVDSLCKVLLSNYIFPDTAARMALYLRKKLETGAYRKITDPRKFAEYLKADLRTVYLDKHLNVSYEPVLQKDTPSYTYIQQAAAKMKMDEDDRQQNYGFSKTEILSGNIGYVAINGFFDLNDNAKQTVNNALGFLIHTKALIIDLRLNGGGQADMVHYIASLFFKKATHINDFYVRSTNELHQNWTEPRAQSDVWSDIPVYVLVSAYTASAAEEFSYDLQSLHRAIIVGEVTGGAAHPMENISIGNGFTANIPFARPINPITKTDWEGTGVKPDITVKADEALDAAIHNFYKQQINSADTLIAINARWMYFIYKAKRHSYKIGINELKKFVGHYNDDRVSFENGHLMYTSATGYKAKLIPISESTFVFETSFDNRELVFHKNSKGWPDAMCLNFDGNLSGIFVRKHEVL